MPVSIVDLGNALRCPLNDCDRFGKILRMKVTKEKVTLDLICEQHMKKYTRIYSVNQFARMSDNALIDDEWVVDFQKHIMIFTGQFIKLRNGMDGAYFTKNPKIVREYGVKLICKCGTFFSVTYLKAKKDKVQFNLYCSKCTPKGKKIWVPAKAAIELSNAGLIPSDVGQKIKAVFSDDGDGFDTSSAYSVGKGIMSSWVQEDLGMSDDDTGAKKCYVCGTRVSAGTDQCPKCGSDL